MHRRDRIVAEARGAGRLGLGAMDEFEPRRARPRARRRLRRAVMWRSLRPVFRVRTRRARRVTAAAAAAAVATAAATPWLAGQVGPVTAKADASMGANRPLAPRHRVALCGWPIKGARQSSDPRVATLRSLFDHCREAGYDGIEMGCDDLKEMGFFPWHTPNREVAAMVQREAAAAQFPSRHQRGELSPRGQGGSVLQECRLHA